MISYGQSAAAPKTLLRSRSAPNPMNNYMYLQSSRQNEVNSTYETNCRQVDSLQMTPPVARLQETKEITISRNIQIPSNQQYHFISHLVSTLNRNLHFSGTVTLSSYIPRTSKAQHTSEKLPQNKLVFSYVLDAQSLSEIEVELMKIRFNEDVDQIHKIFTYMKDRYTIENKMTYLLKRFNEYFEQKEIKALESQKISSGLVRNPSKMDIEEESPHYQQSGNKQKETHHQGLTTSYRADIC